MGAAGSGKTTLGRALARNLGATFLDADEFHTTEAKQKMARGVGLDDADRAPWLARLRAALDESGKGRERPVVLACSALKADYRTELGVDDADVRLVYLSVPKAELKRRLEVRTGHYAGPELLDSQLETLEVPESGLHLDGTRPVSWLVARTRSFLAEPPRPRDP
jgi:gluconokinase